MYKDIIHSGGQGERREENTDRPLLMNRKEN